MHSTDLQDAWQDLASLIEALPMEEKVRFQNAIRMLSHDLRQNIAITQGAEALLRRSIPGTPENLELLDSIRIANQRVIGLVTDLIKLFDSDSDLPAHRPPPGK
ncbi:MAG: hypothetical protein JXA78_09425 [Anaerolineales bacterium]|nr:hypothetical protein [Anaerolineales bacterium]